MMQQATSSEQPLSLGKPLLSGQPLGDAPIGEDVRARATARVAPTIRRSGLASPCIVGAGLAPALEHRPHFLKSAPMGDAPTLHETKHNVGTDIAAALVEIDGRLDQADEGSPYSVGVDGGGTKTLAIVVDAQGRECGRGLAGSANYNVVGLEQAVRHLYSAVEQAASIAGCQLPLHSAWLGIAGIDRPADHDALLPHLHSLANVINLTNDAQLVLSGLDKALGVALIAGTGSIALGRDAQGNTARAGGWGHVLGDEGSGYTIGRMALQAAVRAADGRGSATALLALIMQHWQLNTASDIIGQVYPGEDKASIAHLSALVFTAARAGDLLARKIIQQAANELALTAVTVGAALSFPADQLPLALGGGLLVHEKDFRQQVIRRIRRQRPKGQLVVVDQPALSAARAALDWHSLPA